MRKHNTTFATRWSRDKGDRSNFPQSMTHAFVHSKGTQLFANRLLQALLGRAGIKVQDRQAKSMDDLLLKLKAAEVQAGTPVPA